MRDITSQTESEARRRSLSLETANWSS